MREGIKETFSKLLCYLFNDQIKYLFYNEKMRA